MLELTHEQRQELQSAGETPVRVSDPETRSEYVVVRAEVYDRLKRQSEVIDPSLYEFEEVEPR